jgi:hypothetical protein
MDERSEGCGQTGGFRQILHADRQAVQGAERLALHHGVFGALGGFSSALEITGDNGVQVRIEIFNARNTRVEQFDRRDRFAADQRSQFAGRIAEKVRTHHPYVLAC